MDWVDFRTWIRSNVRETPDFSRKLALDDGGHGRNFHTDTLTAPKHGNFFFLESGVFAISKIIIPS